MKKGVLQAICYFFPLIFLLIDCGDLAVSSAGSVIDILSSTSQVVNDVEAEPAVSDSSDLADYVAEVVDAEALLAPGDAQALPPSTATNKVIQGSSGTLTVTWQREIEDDKKTRVRTLEFKDFTLAGRMRLSNVNGVLTYKVVQDKEGKGMAMSRTISGKITAQRAKKGDQGANPALESVTIEYNCSFEKDLVTQCHVYTGTMIVNGKTFQLNKAKRGSKCGGGANALGNRAQMKTLDDVAEVAGMILNFFSNGAMPPPTPLPSQPVNYQTTAPDADVPDTDAAVATSSSKVINGNEGRVDITWQNETETDGKTKIRIINFVNFTDKKRRRFENMNGSLTYTFSDPQGSRTLVGSFTAKQSIPGQSQSEITYQIDISFKLAHEGCLMIAGTATTDKETFTFTEKDHVRCPPRKGPLSPRPPRLPKTPPTSPPPSAPGPTSSP